MTAKPGETNMTHHTTEITPRQAAIAAGLGLLIMAMLAFFANFFVLETLIIPNDAVKTLNNIAENQMLFRFGIASFLVVIFLDVLVAWALYIFFKTVSQTLSLFAAVFRFVFSAIFAAALFSLSDVLHLVNGSQSLQFFTTEQVQSQVMMALESFQYNWLIALFLFGFHLLVLGYVVVKSNDVPKVLGVVLLVAGLAYIVDTFAQFLLPTYATYETFFLLLVAIPAILGELSLCFWLLFKGVKVQQTRVLTTPQL